MSRLICIGMLLLLMVFLPGCGGCRHAPPKTPEELEKEELEKKRAEEERLKPDFEARALISRPPTDSQRVGCFAKPGHWTAISLEDVVANHFEFVGELEVASTDRDGNPLPIGDTPFHLSICRDMALPKKQTKSLESLVFVPPGCKNASTTYCFNAGQGGRRAIEPLMGVMPSWQYNFVILARTPEAYQYVQKLHSVFPLNGELEMDNNKKPYYHVAMLTTDRRPPLPANANQWTSIAYVLWDDAAPASLDPAQQQAMLDWLHWGGQLILSGPNTLDTLRDSFLAPYLPALSDGVCKLGSAELKELNAFSGKPIRPLAPVQAWSGIRLKNQPRAEFVPDSGKLLAERRVGRGRIVASAFRLSERDFIDWPGRDEVFNAMLLHRPPRKYATNSDGEPRLDWADGIHRLDAARVTGLRYFARDAGVPFATYGADKIESPPLAETPSYPYNSRSRPLDAEVAPASSGVAGWNDFAPVARAARSTLQNAARIEIPNRDFVVWVLAVYLVVLVPINWLVFRGLGRVEWAWVAAPIIAIVGTAIVIHLARLDIGFYRLQTEVAVAEIQGGYSRAHVARYNALYTSLTTYYNFQADDPGAAVLPFPTVDKPGSFTLSYGQQLQKLTCRRGDQVTLSGFPVNSNSTGLVHSEEMLELGGAISLVENAEQSCKLINRSALNLHGVGLVRKTGFGDLEEAWIGEVPAGATAGLGTSVPSKPSSSPPVEIPVQWHTVPDSDLTKLWAAQREQSPSSASKTPQGSLSLRELLRLGLDAERFAPGEVRLVGWSKDNLPGLTIKPASPQVRRGIVVVAHLGYGFGDPPEPDKNLPPNRNQINEDTE